MKRLERNAKSESECFEMHTGPESTKNNGMWRDSAQKAHQANKHTSIFLPFNPQYWFLCHIGLYEFDFEFVPNQIGFAIDIKYVVRRFWIVLYIFVVWKFGSRF